MARGLDRIEAVNAIEERSGSHVQASRAASHSTVAHLVLLGGLGLFAVLIWRTGIDSIWMVLLNVGWSLPLVFLPHALVTVLEASGWWFAFSQKSCPIRFNKILRFTVSAKAVQLVTPSISQVGELVKIHLLRRSGVRADVSVASVISAKTTITISELLFIGFGLIVLLGYVSIEPQIATPIAIGILVMLLFVIGVLVWQRVGLFRSFVWMSRRFRVLTSLLNRYEPLLSSTDGIIKNYLRERRRFGLSCLGYFLGWIAGALEAWVFLAIVGLPNDSVSALVIQAWLVMVTRLTAFVPANIGTHEAGAVMIFSLLGLAPQAAIAFSLLRRLRQVGWTAAGLALLPRAPRTQFVRRFS